MAPRLSMGLAAARPRPAGGDFTALPVETLLAGHGALLARLKLCFGADRAGFERELLPLVRAYAGYVHLLPATADQHFAEPGGLLRLGLETAFFALQGTDAHIFSGGASITERVELEPRWRKATFIAGLCSELHRALHLVTVTTPEGTPWPASVGPLAVWLAREQASHYGVRWRSDAREARGLGLFALPHIVPGALLHDLGQGNAQVVPHLLASVSGVAPVHERNVLDDLVRRALALVVDRDLLARAGQRGAPAHGMHLQRLLVDALRRLAVGHAAWRPNRDKSRVWYGPDGLFLVWPAAGEDLLDLLEGEQLAGIPRDTEVLRDSLVAAGACVAQVDGDTRWSIQPPGAKAAVDALKLLSPALLLPSWEGEVSPLPAALRVARPPASASAPAPTGPVTSPPAPSTPQTQEASSLRPAPPAAPPPPDPQRSLLDGLADDAPDAASPPPSLVQDTPPARLKAPLRLAPSVRAALTQTLQALQDNAGTASACPVPDGLFVALAEFQRLGVQPATALRALHDARMLVGTGPDGTPQITHALHGVPLPGVVIAAAHIDGLICPAPAPC